MIGNFFVDLRKLDEEVDMVIRDSYRPGTRKNLRSQLNNYYEFCDRFGLQEVPADVNQMNRFAVYLFVNKKLKPSTINNNLAAVRTLHGLMNVTMPAEATFLHQAVLRGLKARHSQPVRRATPMDPDVFRLVKPVVNFKDPLELVAWVAVLMGFHLLLRASNITAKTRLCFDPKENLTRKDFRMHHGVMLVHIRWSKTLQYQERKLLIPVIPFVEEDISAIYWFNLMIETIPAGPDSPAFAVPTKTSGGVKLYPLSYNQLSRLLKKWTELAGLKKASFTSHCLRRGGATWLKKRKVEDSVIQAIGDWRTQTFLRYIDSALSTRLDAMIAFAGEN